jgi:lipopolysaccharide kinase (Kdo/WaaP) family protein
MNEPSRQHRASNPSRLLPAVGDPVSSLWRRLRSGTRLLRRAADWDRFAGEGWEERIMSEPVTDRLHEKQGRSIGRRVFATGGAELRVYLKRHYRLPWWHGLLATLFPNGAWSPGLQEWQHLAWAEAEGFPVPRPVAAGQLAGPWFQLQGFLAVEELHDMLPLHQTVPLAARRLSPAVFAHWKRGLTRELARLARELHRRRVFHKDFYFCHFYIPDPFTRTPPQSWVNRVVMIDLHRLGRHRLTAPWWQIKDLAQLLYSSEVEGVTARDRARFWKFYRAGWPHSAPANWLVPAVRWKWRLYKRHARRRKSLEGG